MIDRLYSNPRYVVLLVAIIAISGLAGYVTRPKLEDPKSKVRRGQITTFLSGASPAEVESQVTEPIERVLREAKGIRTIESSSQRGVSIVFVRLTDEIENVENSWSKIQDKLSVVAGQLPPRASKPELVDERRWDSYTTAVALICKREATNSAVLARWGKELENHLRFVEGTRFTEPFGMPREETLVELDEQAIASIGLTPSMVAEKLKSRDSLSPEATSYTDATSTPIEMDGDVNTIDQI